MFLLNQSRGLLNIERFLFVSPPLKTAKMINFKGF